MDITARLFNDCNPLEPPVSDAYVDFGPARGDEAVIATLERRIRRARDYAHLLFSGHPGSGKSTELLRLCDRFKNPADYSSDRYFPVYMDADYYVNRLDVAVTEILLAIISSVAESLQEEDIDLEASYLRSRYDEIKGLLLSEVELEKAEFSLSNMGKLTMKLKKGDANFRRQVRKKLTPQLPSLLDEINLVLAEARIELKKRRYQDLVLVVDNLEKVQDVKSNDAEKGMFYEVFVVGGQQLSDIEAHTVLSIPLPLIHSPQRTELVNTFGEEPRVLPMVKVAEKDGEPCDKGLGLMCEVLSRRFKIEGVKADAVFDSDDTFKYLCRMSGGHVRNLLIYFRSSLDYVDSLPITAQAVERGVRQHINAYSRSIPEENWEYLAQLHLNPNKDIPQNDEHQGMLGDLSILEYMNGGEPWYAVNPVVRELEKFKRAVERLEEDE